MPVDRCTKCGASLGTMTQDALPGVGVPLLCIRCETQKLARQKFALIPKDGDYGFDGLSEWEQGFVTDMARRLAENPEYEISEKQFLVVERIYAKA